MNEEQENKTTENPEKAEKTSTDDKKEKEIFYHPETKEVISKRYIYYSKSSLISLL